MHRRRDCRPAHEESSGRHGGRAPRPLAVMKRMRRAALGRLPQRKCGRAREFKQTVAVRGTLFPARTLEHR